MPFDLDAFSYYIENPSAWDGFEQRVSDQMGLARAEIERLRALLGEIASGLSVRNPFDIANEAIKQSHMKGEG